MVLIFEETEKDEALHINDPKVLLVEDDPITRWLVRVALKGECMLATAPDAGKAISSYHAHQPDMVLLDIGLPGRDGKDLLDRLMLIDPGAYIVMFSSESSPENIAETVEKGAKGFIAKPFTKEEILEHISACPIGH